MNRAPAAGGRAAARGLEGARGPGALLRRSGGAELVRATPARCLVLCAQLSCSTAFRRLG